MSNSTIKIPLSKRGKYAGQFEAIVDAEDAVEINRYNWTVKIHPRNIYASRTVYPNKTELKLHRVIMERILGTPIPEGMEVDHISGDGLDNRRENLRLATRNQNQHNRGKQIDNSSGFKGVVWLKQNKKWIAQIRSNGEKIYLGSFTSKEEAYKAYCEAADKLHKTFKNYG